MIKKLSDGKMRFEFDNGVRATVMFLSDRSVAWTDNHRGDNIEMGTDALIDWLHTQSLRTENKAETTGGRERK